MMARILGTIWDISMAMMAYKIKNTRTTVKRMESARIIFSRLTEGFIFILSNNGFSRPFSKLFNIGVIR